MIAFSRRLVLLFLLTVAVKAGEFEAGNAAYAAVDNAKAAASYEALIQSEGPTAARLYNLGNARMRLEEYGPAILAYERALLLSPRDADIRGNLKIARDAAQANDGLTGLAWWEYPLQWASLHEWSWITVGGAAVAAMAILARGFGGNRLGRWKSAITAAVIGSSLLSSVGGFALWHRRSESKLAIVVAPRPMLRLSPFATAGSAGDCGPGRTVRLGDRVDGWVHVQLRGSQTAGWMREEDTGALMIP